MPAFIREWNLGENSYFLAGGSSFFHRFAGNGFFTKWTGLWKEEMKQLEYFAVCANDEWLSESNSKQFKYDGAVAEHIYQTKLGTVTEQVTLHPTKNELVVVLDFPVSVKAKIELAVDIRKITEDNSNRQHEWKQDKNQIFIKNSLGETKIAFFSGTFEKMDKPWFKTHYPGAEPQTCSANNLYVSGKTIGFSVFFSKESAIQNIEQAFLLISSNRRCFEQISSNLIASNNPKFDNSLAWSRIGIELLSQKSPSGTCLCAGYPWFVKNWGRDTFWALFGLCDLGLFAECREQLELFANKNRNGKIPNKLPDNFAGIDSTLLWIISLAYVSKGEGNEKWMKKMLPFLNQSLLFLQSQMHPSGLLVHDKNANETWMDTLNRPQCAIEIQSLFVKALESAKEFWPFASEKSFPFGKELEKSRIAFKKFFEKEPFPPDRIINIEQLTMDSVQAANAALPLVFNQFSSSFAEKVLDRLESPDFSSLAGLRSRPRNQDGYSGNGYHTGRVWSLTTAWLCMAQFSKKRTANANRTFEAMQLELERTSLGCMGETFDGETGKSNGACLQLWGQALLAHIIDLYLLGIQIDCLNQTISFSPQLPDSIDSVQRSKLIRGKYAIFSAKRNMKTGKFECNIQNAPKGFKIV